MSYDEASFKAGFALGRALWKPKPFYDGGWFIRVKQHDVEQVRPTLNDTFLGTWSGHDQYCYCVNPSNVYITYIANTPSQYPQPIAVCKSIAQIYLGYPDGYSYTQRVLQIEQAYQESLAYYYAGVSYDGPTRLNPNAYVFETLADALSAFVRIYGDV